MLPNGSYFGDELNLTIESPVQLRNKNSADKTTDVLTVSVKSINDSRCPTGVNCMWAGKADVVVSLEKKGGETVNLDLCLGQCSNTNFKETDSTTLTLNGSKYKVTLLQVNPYPSSDNTEEPKVVVLKVEEEL
ncbi:hypothetical protein GCM10027293_27380 [Pontibacter aydingkolensis]